MPVRSVGWRACPSVPGLVRGTGGSYCSSRSCPGGGSCPASRTALPSPPGAGVAETHISVVVFIADRAFKLYKPLRLPFIDQSTPERRLELAEREVLLNRRLAPDVYLGVLDVVRDGEVV